MTKKDKDYSARAQAIYEKLKCVPASYVEEIHCPMILKIMLHKGRVSAFCTESLICERTFYYWVSNHPVFAQCYALGKMFSREAWEIDGKRIKNKVNMPGVTDNEFEYWKMIGWSRFGISKNSRIKLNLKADDTPDKHYSQLLVQASEGDFTAAEIKQLMEAINVGLNTHQVFQLQKEIDQLKSDLAVMATNNGNHTSTNKRVEKEN